MIESGFLLFELRGRRAFGSTGPAFHAAVPPPRLRCFVSFPAMWAGPWHSCAMSSSGKGFWMTRRRRSSLAVHCKGGWRTKAGARIWPTCCRIAMVNRACAAWF